MNDVPISVRNSSSTRLALVILILIIFVLTTTVLQALAYIYNPPADDNAYAQYKHWWVTAEQDAHYAWTNYLQPNYEGGCRGHTSDYCKGYVSGYFDYWERNAGTSPDNDNDNNNTAEDNVSR